MVSNYIFRYLIFFIDSRPYSTSVKSMSVEAVIGRMMAVIAVIASCVPFAVAYADNVSHVS